MKKMVVMLSFLLLSSRSFALDVAGVNVDHGKLLIPIAYSSVCCALCPVCD
jgi:hypothetical protein